MPVAGSVLTTCPQIRRKNKSSGSICHFSFSAIFAVVFPFSSLTATPVSADKRIVCRRVSGTESGGRKWADSLCGRSDTIVLRDAVLRTAALVLTFFFIADPRKGFVLPRYQKAFYVAQFDLSTKY